MKLRTQKEKQTFQKQTALNLECRSLLISTLVEALLPDIKKQMEDNAVGWGQRGTEVAHQDVI